MCGGPERPKSNGVCETGAANLPEGGRNVAVVEKEPNELKESGESDSSLLELAANNDLVGFKQAVEEDVSRIDKVSFWYGRKHGTNQMVLEQRTPVMIAALYGSVDVLNYILSACLSHGVDINRGCGSDNSTALHCAAAGGSTFAVETVKLLIHAGADTRILDALGRRPADMITLSPKLHHSRAILEDMLNAAVGICLNSSINKHSMDSESSFCLSECVYEVGTNSCRGECNSSESVSPSASSPLSSSSETSYTLHPSSSPNCSGSSKAFYDGNEKKEFPVDPSLPDIKNSIYSTDEFRMFSFKVRPCSRAYSHDWTECPFVHPGENARRRDPRRYHYSCVPCPEFRKGACRRGDTCEYAHGVFESWLHPAQYRTRLCKDGMTCERRVCFFAHRPEELRPLFVSTGSAMPALRTSSPLDITSAMSPIAPGSPSSVLMMSPFSPSNAAHGSLLTPPMSPSSSSANALSHSSLGGAWSQPNLPPLHLPSGGFQASRLRAALHARDLALEDLTRGSDYEGQIINEFSPMSAQARMSAAVASACGNSRSGKFRSNNLNTVAPTNLEDLFGSEISSPRVVDIDHSVVSQMSPQMQSHKTMHAHSQLQKQLQLSINTQILPQMQQVALDHQSPGHSISQSSVMSPSYGLSSLGRASSFGADLEGQKSSGSPALTTISTALNSRTAAFAQRERRSFSSRDLATNVPPACSPGWGSPTGKVDWGVQAEELSKFRKSVLIGHHNSDEQDSSWVQTLRQEAQINSVDGGNLDCGTEISNNGHLENTDHLVLASWLEQMDQLVS